MNGRDADPESSSTVVARDATQRPAARLLLTGLLAASAVLWLWSSLAAIANFAFRYPAFDQFRLYAVYLGLPFPENAIQLENGHRPILPALIRLAEIRWFGADQSLQIAVGLGAALASLGLIVATIVRERSLDIATRAAAILLAVIAVFWLGNARILMHGNELVHVYFVVLFVVLAILALDRARTRASIAWIGAASACCFAAAISFGTGMAAFSALLLLGATTRLRASRLAIPAAVLALALIVYAWGLPGDRGIRNTLLLDPVGNLAVLAQWLSAPLMDAWLGHGDPIVAFWDESRANQPGPDSALIVSARAIAALFGEQSAQREGFLFGCIGILAFAGIAIRAWRRGAALSSTRLLALGLAAFGLGAGIIVCVARLRAFQLQPGQVFADRYLPWSCLFWFGLALYALAGARRPAQRSLALVMAGAVAVLFSVTQRYQAGWSETVDRHVRQSAVAAQLGIWDPQRLPDDASAHRADTLRSLGLLREARLSMYAEPGFAQITSGWHAPSALPAPLAGAEARVVQQFDDTWGHRQVAAFEGWIAQDQKISRDASLVVVDAGGNLRGLAKLSFLGPATRSLRLDVPVKRGFDGYVLDARPGEDLEVLLLDNDSRDVVAKIALRIPALGSG